MTSKSGIRLEVKSNIGPLFNLLFDPGYWPNIEYFSNNEARSSYLPKFAKRFKVRMVLESSDKAISIAVVPTQLNPKHCKSK